MTRAAENIFAKLPSDIPEELFQNLVASGPVRIERIVSLGHTSPQDFWYDQELDEWVLVLQGAARLEFESGEPVTMQPGSYMLIPAHARHRVAWTDPTQATIWLAVHFENRSSEHATGAG